MSLLNDFARTPEHAVHVSHAGHIPVRDVAAYTNTHTHTHTHTAWQASKQQAANATSTTSK